MTTSEDPNDSSGKMKPADPEWAQNVLEAFADRLKFEHDVISHRMGWLMTLNSFLIGGAAVLSANSNKFSNHAFLIGALILIFLVGAISNASCVYSNTWADTAIRGAASSLAKVWVGAGEDLEMLRNLGRLYGRDPKSFTNTKPDRFHLRDMLHPWLLLPTMFSIVFCFASLFTNKIMDDKVSLWLLSFPALLTSTFVVAGIGVHLRFGERLWTKIKCVKN